MNETYRSYFYNNPIFYIDCLLLILQHISGNMEIFAVLYCIYNQNISFIHIVLFIIFIRIILDIILLNLIKSKKNKVNINNNIENIHRVIYKLNQYLTDSSNIISKKQKNKLEGYLHKILIYYKLSYNKYLCVNNIVQILIFILPIIIFIITYFIQKCPLKSFTITILILILIIPYTKIILLYFNTNKLNKSYWILGNIIERIITIYIIYTIIQIISNNIVNKLDYNSIFQLIIKKFLNILNTKNSLRYQNNKYINLFDDLCK